KIHFENTRSTQKKMEKQIKTLTRALEAHEKCEVEKKALEGMHSMREKRTAYIARTIGAFDSPKDRFSLWAPLVTQFSRSKKFLRTSARNPQFCRAREWESSPRKSVFRSSSECERVAPLQTGPGYRSHVRIVPHRRNTVKFAGCTTTWPKCVCVCVC